MNLIQIVKKIENFVNNHGQLGLGHFSFGSIGDTTKVLNLKMPHIWTDVISSNITQHADRYIITLYAFDIPSNSQNNSLDILNDCSLYINDILSLIYSDNELQLYLEERLTKKSFRYRFDDYVDGWSIEIPISIPRNQKVCETPGYTPQVQIDECFSCYNAGFASGFFSGQTNTTNYQDGFNSGFTFAETFYPIYYSSGFTDGYFSGFTDGEYIYGPIYYNSGLTDGQSLYPFYYSSGFTDGFNDGILSGLTYYGPIYYNLGFNSGVTYTYPIAFQSGKTYADQTFISSFDASFF